MTATRSNTFNLDPIDLVLCRAALHELARSAEDPVIGKSTERAQRMIEHGKELVGPDRRAAVLALQVYAMNHGEVAFCGVVSVSRKIGIEADLRACLKEWIEFSKIP